MDAANQLSPEIIASVISYVSPRHLIDTALVCRAWTYISLKQLYRTVYIHNARQLYKFMNTLPRLDSTYRNAIRHLLFNGQYTPEGLIVKPSHLQEMTSHTPHVDTIAFVAKLECAAPPLGLTHAILSNDVDVIPHWPFEEFPANLPYLNQIGVLLDSPSLQDHLALLRHPLTLLTLTPTQWQTDLLPPYRESCSPPASPFFPYLTSLTLCTRNTDTLLLAPCLVWVQQHCPVLDHLTVDAFTLEHIKDIPDKPPPVTVPHTSVKSLRIRADLQVQSLPSFAFFAAIYPGLRNLSLFVGVVDDGDGLGYPHYFQDGLGEEQFAPEHTDIAQLQLWKRELLDWLANAAALTSLDLFELGSAGKTVKMIQAITYLATQGSWKPRLTHLRIGDSTSPILVPIHSLMTCNALVGSVRSLALSFDVYSLSFDLYSPRLTQLSLMTVPPSPPLLWMGLFVACPALTSLSLRGFFLQPTEISQPAGNTADPDHASLYPHRFPLTRLTLVNCDLESPHLVHLFLRYALPKLSFINWDFIKLPGIRVPIYPALHLPDHHLSRLWLANIKIGFGESCSVLRVFERRGPRVTEIEKQTWTRLMEVAEEKTSPIKQEAFDLGDPQELEPRHPKHFHVVCNYAEDIMFNSSLGVTG
ncbi:hypothetical protein DM01DRAFT_1331076 [Hesseltinella vesiculosa]|uniref:F-box domain-containing protein n=1 Tax=Hesseltinella vesiculosa TaxID=101127 RepID=A0A1X2GY72_9FUNG|nr:hypothetical protein DM01DRAFT_1331076 [Hesseltinella vesiculosa]